ncbi:amidohydrolase [Segniliparus rotundus DSM 44985]|uniref:Amidohydrolase n=1 Tax=Segniliparus rotundus (strain ATCC BAA-972 / CDC 1076 / CIP 108378 / DSM 44985 / JCM 13578) TaxID=640132 RepID=D6ZCD4_SEGRD|nr:amidohydrolase [Segniliparus rotundus DSM 44985]
MPRRKFQYSVQVTLTQPAIGGSAPLSWQLDSWLAARGEDLVRWRRQLHEHPELSRHEHATTAFLEGQLRALGLAPKRLPVGVGLVCDIGPESARGRVALRADLDALPVAEATGLDFASRVDGVSHACGHDLHAAILLGVAAFLAAQPDLPIGVRLIFQPAEEVMPGGALDVVAAGGLAGVERIFAVHCDPHLQVGKIGLKEGAITSAADTVHLTLESPGGHTSRPHLTGDLVYALGAVVTGLPGLLSRRADPRTGTVVTFGSAHAGSAPNAIPQTGELKGTARTSDYRMWLHMEPLIAELVRDLLAPLGVRHRLRYQRGVPPVVNDAACTALFAAAAGRLGDDALAETAQSGGGEDFSWYLQEAPGAMARLGVWSGDGPQCDIHQPDFVADERALAVGVRLFAELVWEAAKALGPA